MSDVRTYLYVVEVLLVNSRREYGTSTIPTRLQVLVVFVYISCKAVDGCGVVVASHEADAGYGVAAVGAYQHVECFGSQFLADIAPKIAAMAARTMAGA